MHNNFTKKKIIILLTTIIIILMICISLLNVKVTTRQGINYKVQTLKIPLYLKILDFYDRHYNYKWLVQKIVKDEINEREKAMAIFEWTVKNIAKQPKELPVVDDHVWHIIVRGYGIGDQFSDVFTTLCNYANLDAFFFRLYNKDRTKQIPFSFVKVDNKWCVFDPRAGIYFTKKANSFASVEDIARGDWEGKSIAEYGGLKIDYAEYFGEILSINFAESHRLSRANLQLPISRLIYEIKKKFQ